MKISAIFLINIYKAIFSPVFHVVLASPNVCRFNPTCSEYMKEAIIKHGVLTGLILGGKRIIKCR